MGLFTTFYCYSLLVFALSPRTASPGHTWESQTADELSPPEPSLQILSSSSRHTFCFRFGLFSSKGPPISRLSGSAALATLSKQTPNHPFSHVAIQSHRRLIISCHTCESRDESGLPPAFSQELKRPVSRKSL